MSRLAILLALLLLSLSAVAAPAQRQPALDDFAAVELAPAGRDAQLSLSVSAFGRSWALELRDNEASFALLDPGDRRALLAGDDRFLKGRVRGAENSWARLNWIDGQWSGGFFDGDALYLVDEAAGLRLPEGRTAAPGATIVYRMADLDFDGLVSHEPVRAGETPPLLADYSSFVRHLKDIARAGDAMFSLPVTVVSDTQFSDTHGSNTASVVAGRTNFVDGIYSNQIGTGIALHHHEILADNGPLTSSDPSQLLGDFADFMFSGAGSDFPFQGLAHLFTGRDMDGNVIGIAYFGDVLCSEFSGYGVDQDLSNDTTSALVYAHELGHNFNAPHDGEGACSDETFDGIMNPVINGSQQFSDCSINIIMSAVADAQCLVEDITQETIFLDQFEDG